MAGVFNVNGNSEKFNIKKLSNTINLRIGQRVYGRIIGKNEDDQTIIKLVNGVEIHADIDGLMQELGEGFLAFSVDGFKDGKLQLKVINGQVKDENSLVNDLIKFAAREGVAKDDITLLEGMLKYDIPLTKENISEVKSLVQFKERIDKNSNEIDSFINKYLNSKDIPKDSERGQMITGKLQEFFHNFKDLEVDTLMLFVENNIDFSTDNIESYNKLFLNNGDIDSSLKAMENNIDEKVDIIIPKEIITEDMNFEALIKPKDIEEKLNKPIFRSQLFNILKDNGLALNKRSLDVLYNIIDKIPNDHFTKDSLERVLGKVLGQPINISTEKFDIIKGEVVDIKAGHELIDKEISVKSNTVFEKADSSKSGLGQQLKGTIILKAEHSKEIVNKLLNLLESEIDTKSEIFQSIKNNINDVKLFNRFSQEYYYVNFPAKMEHKEYPCKLIIKDDRKSGKQLDSKNLKIALNIKTINLGNIDSLVKIKNQNMDIELRCDKKYTKVFEISKFKLQGLLQHIGYAANIRVVEVKTEFSFESCREFFDHNGVAGIDAKV